MIRLDSHTPAIAGQVLLATSVIVHGVLNFVAEHKTRRLLTRTIDRKEQVTGNDQSSPG